MLTCPADLSWSCVPWWLVLVTCPGYLSWRPVRKLVRSLSRVFNGMSDRAQSFTTPAKQPGPSQIVIRGIPVQLYTVMAIWVLVPVPRSTHTSWFLGPVGPLQTPEPPAGTSADLSCHLPTAEGNWTLLNCLDWSLHRNVFISALDKANQLQICNCLLRRLTFLSPRRS